MNYYEEIDNALKRYEECRYPTHEVSWITDRIWWCWKFRKITRDQMIDLTDRATSILSHI